MLIACVVAADFTPPSPQPCQAWFGYRVTMAHHEEVGVSADGRTCERCPLRGRRRCVAGGRKGIINISPNKLLDLGI
jgi:hypothetical protein